MEVKPPGRIARFPGRFCGRIPPPVISIGESVVSEASGGDQHRRICRLRGLRRTKKPADDAGGFCGSVVLWFCVLFVGLEFY